MTQEQGVSVGSIDDSDRYWTDAKYRRLCDAETRQARALINMEMDYVRISNGRKWPAHWTEQEKADATAELWRGYEEWSDEQDRRYDERERRYEH